MYLATAAVLRTLRAWTEIVLTRPAALVRGSWGSGIVEIIHKFFGIKVDTISPEEAARIMLEKEVTFKWHPQIVELSALRSEGISTSVAAAAEGHS